MPESNSFFNDVYEVVRLIPPGRVTSYGAIARYLGSKNARVVGWAMNGANAADVPAHRVVNSVGILTGAQAFDPDNNMEDRLRKEGIEIRANRIVNFKSVFWDPSIEL